jgi:hypothetical protein
MHIYLLSHLGTVLCLGTASVGALSLKHNKRGIDFVIRQHLEIYVG